ncbi:MAG: VWA domain-containing protein [Planctomycetota bacterium]|jgi:Mg-chelatase subunit ChlD
MGLTHPWWIAAAGAAGVLCVVLAWRAGGRARTAAFAAAAGLLCLGLGLAGPWRALHHPGDRLLVFAVDCSDSIPVAERARAAARVREAWEAGAPARRALIAFGADAVLLVAPGEPLPADLDGALAAAPLSRHTSLVDPALAMAAALRHGEEPAHCICFTDGALLRDSPHDLPLPLSVVPLAAAADAAPDLVACEALEGPDVAESGAPVTLALRYHAREAAGAELVLADGAGGADGNEVLARKRVSLRAGGPHLLALPSLLLAAGPHVLTATLRLEPADPRPENNRAVLALDVLDPPPVLIVSDAPTGPGALTLRKALAAQAIPAETVKPGEVDDARLDAVRVVIWEAPRNGPAAAAPGSRIAGWVRRGGGLVVTTGTDALEPATGLGGVLPAVVPPVPPPPDPEPETQPEPEPPPEEPPNDPPKPKEVEFVPVGLILIIDKSGSMQGPKIRLAREAAIAALELLDAKDRLGVLAVDQESRWVLDPASALTKAQAIDRISRLVAGGGTNLYPALIEARDAVRKLPVGARHVVLLTDGHDEHVREFQTLAEGMKQRGITVSTIGIGDQFDAGLLTKLATWGGGKMDYASDIRRVPAVVLDRVKWAIELARPPDADPAPEEEPPDTPPTPPEEEPKPPDDTEAPPPPDPIPLRFAAAHPVVARLDRSPASMPAVAAVRNVEPRGRVVTLLEGVPGGAPARPTLLLHHAGAGRVALLALDLGAEAGHDLGRWAALPALLAQAVRFLGPPPPPPAIIATSISFGPAAAAPHGALYGHVVWTVAGGANGAALQFSAVRVGDGGDDPEPLEPIQTGVRRWECRLPAPAAGALLRLQAAVSLEGEMLAEARHAVVRPPAPESITPSDTAAIDALVNEGGGMRDPGAAAIAGLLPVPASRESLAWWCWLVAILLFLPAAWGVRQV